MVTARLKRLYSPSAIPSWIIILWKIAEAGDTMSSIIDWGNPVWQFLDSSVGTIVLLLIGFGILIYLVVKPEKKPKPAKVNPPLESTKLSQLLDIAEKQRDNPVTHLEITDRVWFEFKREVKLPFIWVRIYYKNLGVNDLMIALPEGYAYYDSERLPDRIVAQEGRQNVPANGGIGQFDLNIYIPLGFRDDVCVEVDLPRREIRKLQLHEISSKVYIKGDDTRCVKWSLGGERAIFRPNG